VVQRKHRVLSPEKDVAPVVPAGREREIFELKGFRMAIAICSDSGIPNLHEALAKAGCDAIIVPTAGAGDESFGFHRAALADPAVRAKFTEAATYRFPQEAIARALRLDLAEIACNQAGWDGRTGYFHPGGSSVLDRTGELTAIIPPHWIFEDLRPELAVGSISRRARRR
jgi:predicted amidohydrolase